MHKQTIKELEDLFSLAPPDSLMRSVHEVFFTYLMYVTEPCPDEHKKIVEDFYFLMNFLEKANSRERVGNRELDNRQ